jgi:hypothetical protein
MPVMLNLSAMYLAIPFNLGSMYIVRLEAVFFTLSFETNSLERLE